jgi:UPF0716 protein FxsA
MAFVLFLFAVALPLVEITVLVKVGQAIGFWPTLGILVGMALSGLVVLYWQGWSTMRQMQLALQRGEAPLGSMFDGLLLVIAGLLLLIPGLLTDVVALPLLIPPVRRWIARWILSRVPHTTEIHIDQTHDPGPERPAGSGPVIEGEFERLDERPLRPTRHDNGQRR